MTSLHQQPDPGRTVPCSAHPQSFQLFVPAGSINIFSIYLRGLLANALLILPWLLVLAAITIFLKPDSESLHVSIRGITLPEAFNADHFGATLILLYVFGLLLLIWGLWRSLEISDWEAEIGSPWTLVSAIVLILLLLIAFCELQPLVLDGIFKSAAHQGGIFASFVGWLQALAAVLAPFSAAVAFFSRPIGRLLKQGAEKPSIAALASRAAGRAAVYIAGAPIPFLLWMAYLYLCFVGIKDVNWSDAYHAPLWLRDVSQHWFGSKTPIGWFYLVTGIVLFLLSLSLARSQRKFPSPSLSRSVEQGFPVRSHQDRRSAFGDGVQARIRVATRSGGRRTVKIRRF